MGLHAPRMPAQRRPRGGPLVADAQERVAVVTTALARIEQWIGRGAGIVCSGADKAPLKLDGAVGGSFNTDHHHDVASLAELISHGRARGFGISFADPACRFVCVDIDVKGKEEIDGKRLPIPNAIAELWMRNTLPALAPTDETYVERTPSGGWHFVFARPSGWEGKGKVAHTFADGSGVEVFVATGWVRMAPSPDYEVLADREPVELDLEELGALVGSVEMLAAPEPAPPRRPLALAGSEESVIEWANRTLSTPEMLVDAGWSIVAQHGAAMTLRRPGKSRGVSANFNHLGTGTLKVFTDAAEAGGFDVNGTHSPYWVYVVTKYHGDKHAATRALGEQMRREQERTFTSSPRSSDPAPMPGADDWPEPIPLGETRGRPDFPLGALPAWIGEFAADVARDIQVSADLPAQLGLIALATAAAKKAKIQIQGTWVEHLNLYVAIALPPSAGKSPAFRAMLKPLQDLEREMRALVEDDIVAAEARRDALVKRRKNMVDQQRSIDVAEIDAELRANPVPVRPQLTVDDATPEALVSILGQQGGRVALLSPEGDVFGMMGGRYSEKSNLTPYLKAWGGEDIKVDRIGRSQVDVVEAVLSIGLTVQPIVLEALADVEMRGKGLAARFMYSVPVDLVGRRDMRQAASGNAALRARYEAQITDLAKRLATYQAPGTLTLAPDALAAFFDFRQSLEDERGESGDLRSMAEWTGKLETSVARVAGLLHVAEHGATGVVELATMQRAIAIGDYWLAHARIVHDLWGRDPELEKARVLLRWMATEGLSEFSVRDAHHARKKHFARVDDLVAPLDILTERGWIKPLFDGALSVGRRGMPSPRYAVFPRCARELTKSTAQRQEVVAHVAHVPKGEFSVLTHSLQTATHTEMSAHGPHGPQLPEEPPGSAPVDNPDVTDRDAEIEANLEAYF